MGAHDGENDDSGTQMSDRFTGHRLRPEPLVFEKVSDRDLITLADVLCRSLEFHSMLLASKVMSEVGVRELWPAVVDRRAQSIRLSAPDADEDDLNRIAAGQIRRFREDHFPVEPEQFGDDPTDAARRWNAYIAF